METETKIEDPKESCRLGQGTPCCVYLTLGSDGFECVKGTSLESVLKKRLDAGTTNAKGEGDWKECLWTDNE